MCLDKCPTWELIGNQEFDPCVLDIFRHDILALADHDYPLIGFDDLDGHRSSFRGIRFSGWMTLCHGDQGRGRFVHANGDVYEGQWLDDKARPTASKG